MAHAHSGTAIVGAEQQQQQQHTNSRDHYPEHAPTHDTYAQANREYYDKHVNSYQQIPLVEEAGARISSAFLATVPSFSKAETTVLDFACGTGLISRALAPHARRVVGVDISGGMVDAYNAAMREDGFTPEEAYAVRLELTGRENELKGELFDVVVCSMAYHHVDSIEKTTRILVSHLRPGGVLLIADRIKSESESESGSHHQHYQHEHHQHQHQHQHQHHQYQHQHQHHPNPTSNSAIGADPGSAETHMKHVHDPEDLKRAVKHVSGFSEEEITSTLVRAGLTQVLYDPCVHVANEEIAHHIFIAKGVKPAV